MNGASALPIPHPIKIVAKSGSGVRFRLTEPGDAIAFFPLAALFEQFNTFKTLHDITLSAGLADGAQTRVL
jgi:hypothetical protein